MTLHEFGQNNKDVILLIHPSLVMWDYFEYVIPLLEDRYHLIVPAIPGYDEENPGDFTSVEKIASSLADQLGIDDFRAEVLPEDKAEYIRKERAAGRSVIMIGDGINDTPALSLADVGIAVGSGAVIAREVADVTIAAEDLNELAWLKRLSDALMSRISRNYRFVMSFNGALILLGALGILPPATSALLHNTSTLLLSMNCMTELLENERKK